MGKRGDVTQVDAIAQTQALVEMINRGHELKNLLVGHLHGVDEEDSKRRTIVRIRDAHEGEYYQFTFHSLVWDERHSAILSFELKYKGDIIMSMNTLQENIIVRYSASEENKESVAWLNGLAAGREDLMVVTDGNRIADEGDWQEFHVELKTGSYPEPAEGVSVSFSIDGPSWIGTWHRFESDVRRVFEAADSVQSGVEQVVAQFGDTYAFINRFADAHNEFGESDTPEMAELRSWTQEHGTDEQFMIVFGVSREWHARFSASNLDLEVK